MVHKSTWPTLRLMRVLAEQKVKLGSFAKLAKAIQRASDMKVNPRKLRRIVNGDVTVSITVKDFVAIDAFLAPLGEGLTDSPLFDSPWLLNGLVDLGSVLLLLGSHPEGTDRRANLSRWDLKAAAAVTRRIHSAGPATGIIIDDVVFEEDPCHRYSAEGIPSFDDVGASVCVVGSPRACWAAEIVLAEMCGVTGCSGTSSAVPFHFVWSDDLENLCKTSAFALDASVALHEHPEDADEFDLGAGRALQVGNKLYLTGRSKGVTRWKDYGVAVAQRRENGRVFMVLAGLSGPATFAAADAMVSHRAGTLPRAPDGGGHGLARCALVEATVEDHGGPGDSRNVVGTRVINTFLYP